jgi:thiamine kinase-like enzyme
MPLQTLFFPVADDQILKIAASLTERTVSSVDRHMGGGNNRIFRVRTADNHSYALKEYPRRTNDSRDRLGAEFAALQFLERCGVTNVPKAIASDPTAGFALYEWIDGVTVSNATAADIDAALEFIASLHKFRTAKGADELPLASEACLAPIEIVAQLSRRLARLNEVARSEPRLARFLSDEYAPVTVSAEAWSRRGYESAGWAFDRPIANEDRSLSPSDFGFHNAIRRADGRLVFVDFEYFGWDDPAKLAADFLLHPGMRLSPSQYERFRAGTLKIYGEKGAFAMRLALVYPLYGLRWCMILLNEFLPERWEVRRRAGVHVDRDAATAGQMEKARERISIVRQYIVNHAQ